MTIRIEPYRLASRGARRLALRSGILRTTPSQMQSHNRNFDIIINWGNSERRFPHAQYLNDPTAVATASDKVAAMQAFQRANVPIAPFTVSKSEAEEWLADGETILARTLTRASGGRGITVVAPRDGEDDTRTSGGGPPPRGLSSHPAAAYAHSRADLSVVLLSAPLYVVYRKKRDEYRVHIYNGRMIDAQQKRKRQEVPNDEVNYQIRNANRGWVYCRGGVTPPRNVVRAAVSAVAALGLDFGAADVGYNIHNSEACVYEVNTAPGLEGTTLSTYYNAIRDAFPQINSGAYARRRRQQRYG